MADPQRLLYDQQNWEKKPKTSGVIDLTSSGYKSNFTFDERAHPYSIHMLQGSVPVVKSTNGFEERCIVFSESHGNSRISRTNLPRLRIVH